MTAARKSQQELIDLIAHRFPNIACVRCGNQRLALIDQPERGVTTAIPLYGPGDRLPGRSLPADAVTLACTNCGHVEQFLLSFLDPVASDIDG
ncbi:MAG: hypothetical protein K2Z25_08905 [Beijerinckiaceae bacterium]|nr:hypothetical protein [Beijerinckiaceae bacterium]